MAGHSHAKNVMHKKAAQDKKKAKVYTKHARNIANAAKSGDINPETNHKLRIALKQAHSDNVPKEVITKALEKQEKENLEEILYEGYGPEGVGILVETLTDNKNRTASQIRELFTKNNIKIAEPNSVKFLFQHLAMIELEPNEKITEIAIELNVVEIQENKLFFKIEDFHKGYLELEKHFVIKSSHFCYIAQNLITIENKEKLLKIIENLEEHEEVQNCWHNFQ